MLNNFRKEQIVDKDNITKFELSNLNPNNNIFLTKTSSGGNISPEGEWGFNEGSGTVAADSIGSIDFTVNSPTWGSGFVHSTHMSLPSGGGSSLPNGDFSIVTWIEFRSGGPINNGFFIELGTGDIHSYSNFSFTLGSQGGGRLGVVTSNGTTGNSVEVPSGPSFTTGVKYLCIMTYIRVGGANNNILKLRYTSDGSSWYETTTSSEVLIQSNPSFMLTTISDTGSSFRMLANYYRLDTFSSALTNQEMQDIWDTGSEGNFPGGLSDIVTLTGSNENPSSLLINNKLYRNTTDTTLQITGSAGKRHIFAVANSGNTFILESILPTDTAPDNSRFIGIIDWDGSEITSVDSSLSKVIEKETFEISSTESTLTLNQLDFTDTDIPLLFVNGDMLVNDLNYSLSNGVIDFSPSEVISGDTVSVVKIRNSASFNRPIIQSVFDPMSISDGFFWIDSSDATSMSVNGFNQVTAWNDKSSYARTSTVGGITPLIATNYINGKNAVNFANNQVNNGGWYDYSVALNGSEVTVFAVAKRNTVNTSGGQINERYVIFFNAGGNDFSSTDALIAHYYRHDGTPSNGLQALNYRAGTQVDLVDQVDTWALHCTQVNASTRTLYRNNTSAFVNISQGSFNSNTLRIGGAWDGNTSNPDNLIGHVAEVIIYKRNLLQTEREQVLDYLGSKWAIPGYTPYNP